MGRLRIKPSERIGTIGYNNYGSEMVVDEYYSPADLWVRFIKNGNKVHTNWNMFCKGVVRNVYDKTTYGVGFIGEGQYQATISRIYTPQYISWSSMMQRCYDDKFHEKHPTYKGCTVCTDWHNFQNFAKWYNENYYEIEEQRIALDKDILVKGNKIYSPETCIFTPQFINCVFLKTDANRGKHPIGVHHHKSHKYQSKCSDENGKQVSLGYYNTPYEAFQAYKEFKEKVIIDIAYQWEDKIPSKLFDAMISYTVDILD